MKKLFTLFICASVLISVNAQTNIFPATGSAGIGTLSPNTSSVLDMQSSNQGLLVPRMTKAQRNAITSPAAGLLIYQVNAQPGFYYYTGSTWSSIAGAGFSLPFSASVSTDGTSPFQITNNGIAPTLYGINNGIGGIGVYGRANGTGFSSGVFGFSESGYGVQGYGGAGGGLGAYFSADLGYALVTGNGAVGLGESSPSAKVHIDGGSYTRALQVESSGITKFSINSDGGAVVGDDLANGPDNGLYVLGATGIGTSSPNSKMHINSATGENPLRVQVNGTTKLYTNSNGGTSIGSSATPPTNGLYVSGNVGLGITTPAVRMHLYGSNELMRIGGTNPYIQFYSGTTTEIGYLRAIDNDLKLATNTGNTLGKLILGADGLERFFIHESGEVTINTSTAYPNYELGIYGDLHVSSQIALGTTTALAAPVGLTVQGDGGIVQINGTEPYISMRHEGTPVGFMQADGDDLRIATFGENAIGRVILASNYTTRMYIDHGGNIVMGGYSVVPKAGYKLSVDGRVVCEELRVEISPWADYVFDENYELMSLYALEIFITENKHLPGIPSANEVEENGLHVGEMQALMMEKVEELTLYIIELKKENDMLAEKIIALENK